MVEKILLILLLPLSGAVVNGLLGRKMPRSVSGILATAVMFAAFGLSVLLFLDFMNAGARPVTVSLLHWFSAGTLSVDFALLIDRLSLLMMLVVTGVGSLIHLYSVGYMKSDEGYTRYFAYLNLFVFSMLLLVTGADYLVMFAGWEGVGLCSFLLIGFWFKNKEYGNAARKAFIMNRIGDLGFLIGLILILLNFGSLSYDVVFQKVGELSSAGLLDNNTVVLITLLLFVGATGKSAQIPLYTWLPDAMAGPTPVSALIHAATMVTAGIYMVVRSNILYALAPFTSEIITYVGLATALLAASVALVQNDIKKVLAYSTVSQLGYMVLALGLGAYSSAVFHLVTHAFFKALLFLGAGSVIHAMSGEQDIRRMGALRKALPLTFATFLVGTLGISGLPPFAGFFSKDQILAHAFEKNPILWAAAFLGALMTAFYMFRLFYLTFFGTFRGSETQKAHLHESPLSMTLPLMILAVLTALGGLLGIPEVFGGNNFLAGWLAPLGGPGTPLSVHLSHATEYALMGASVAGVLLMLGIAWSIYVKKATVPPADTSKQGFFYRLLQGKYYIDELYNMVFVKPLKILSEFLRIVVENVFIDGIVFLTGRLSVWSGRALGLFQSGNIGFYVFMMVLGLAGLLLLGKLVF